MTKDELELVTKQHAISTGAIVVMAQQNTILQIKGTAYQAIKAMQEIENEIRSRKNALSQWDSVKEYCRNLCR